MKKIVKIVVAAGTAALATIVVIRTKKRICNKNEAYLSWMQN